MLPFDGLGCMPGRRDCVCHVFMIVLVAAAVVVVVGTYM
jgi:hypothetical protein